MLKAASEHPLFAKHVTELVSNTSIFDKRLVTDKFQKRNYERYLRRQIKDGQHFDHELTEEDLAKSHERYLDYYWEQRSLFQSGEPVVCLTAALPLLPKLQKLRVVRGWKYLELDGDEGGPSGRSWDITIVPPGICGGNNEGELNSWYWECESRWMEIFLKMLLATAFTNRPLLSLDMGLPGFGVSMDSLDLSSADLGHWQNAFCHLQSLELGVDSKTYQGTTLGAVVQSAPGLEILRLHLTRCVGNLISLIQLLGTRFTIGISFNHNNK